MRKILIPFHIFKLQPQLRKCRRNPAKQFPALKNNTSVIKKPGQKYTLIQTDTAYRCTGVLHALRHTRATSHTLHTYYIYTQPSVCANRRVPHAKKSNRLSLSKEGERELAIKTDPGGRREEAKEPAHEESPERERESTHIPILYSNTRANTRNSALRNAAAAVAWRQEQTSRRCMQAREREREGGGSTRPHT